MTEREFAISVVQRLQDAGFQALWAGGCVRDEYLNLTPKDYDVATNARPEQVQKLFRRTVAVGLSFGVVEVLSPRLEGGHWVVQVATFRSDVSYSDGRRPDQVIFSDAREDALRRDFTINGMFFDPMKVELLDYVGGREDLQARILRAIGDAQQRFQEDKLRLLRAVRIATRFGLEIEPYTMSAIQAMAGQVSVVSAERIADELRKLLVDPQRKRGVQLLEELHLIAPVFPELLPVLRDHRARWEHTLAVLELLDKDISFPLAFAALLRQIAEPVGNTVFEIGKRLRLSNEEIDRAVWLVEKRDALREPKSLRLSVLKKLFVHPGIDELLTLHEAIARAEGVSTEHVGYCRGLLAQWTANDINPPPLLTGDDLKQMGLKPGRHFKEILDAVRDAQLDGILSTRKEAEAWMGQHFHQWFDGMVKPDRD